MRPHAGAALAFAGAVLLVNGGGELSEPPWAIWALSFVTACRSW